VSDAIDDAGWAVFAVCQPGRYPPMNGSSALLLWSLLHFGQLPGELLTSLASAASSEMR
jgi:hypothetical protein